MYLGQIFVDNIEGTLWFYVQLEYIFYCGYDNFFTLQNLFYWWFWFVLD